MSLKTRSEAAVNLWRIRQGQTEKQLLCRSRYDTRKWRTLSRLPVCRHKTTTEEIRLLLNSAWDPFKAHIGHFFDQALKLHNSPADSARELFKPSTDSARRLVEIEKKSFLFLVWSSLWGRHKWGFCFFCEFYQALGANPMSQFFGSGFV